MCPCRRVVQAHQDKHMEEPDLGLQERTETRTRTTGVQTSYPDSVVASTPALTEQTREDEQTFPEIPLVVSRLSNEHCHGSDESIWKVLDSYSPQTRLQTCFKEIQNSLKMFRE